MCVVQIYTIHGYLNGEGMPLVWALLPNNTTETYVELFSALRDALLTTFGTIGNVTTVLTDFEHAAINALSQVFLTVRVKGCSFHFRQAMTRRIQREGLKAAHHGHDHVAGIRHSTHVGARDFHRSRAIR